MTKPAQITANIDGLNDFIKRLGGNFTTRVGVLGGKTSRTSEGAGNAEIGLVHEMGSKTKNIPARSFLRMPLELKSNDLVRAIDGSKSIGDAIKRKDYKRVYELMGVQAEKIIQDAFSTGGFGQWADISKATKSRKGSDGILKDSQQLRRSITHDVKNRGDI